MGGIRLTDVITFNFQIFFKSRHFRRRPSRYLPPSASQATSRRCARGECTRLRIEVIDVSQTYGVYVQNFVRLLVVTSVFMCVSHPRSFPRGKGISKCQIIFSNMPHRHRSDARRPEGSGLLCKAGT
jgi:hypothetical protein